MPRSRCSPCWRPRSSCGPGCIAPEPTGAGAPAVGRRRAVAVSGARSARRRRASCLCGTVVRSALDDWRVPLRVLSTAAGELRDVLRGASPTHRRLRDILVAVTLCTFGVDALCAILAFLLEHHSQQTDIKTFGSAVFWTTTQLLSVSSQLRNPLSVGGRILDVFMEIYAITVIASLAGAFGSFLQKRAQEIDSSR